MLWTGFFVLVRSHIFTFKNSLEIIYLPFCVKSIEPTVAMMSVKKFFNERVSGPKSITLPAFASLFNDYMRVGYRIDQVSIDSCHTQKCCLILGAFWNK
jgi:hypothetical protein